ncbi:MAG: DUF357 domain-containing protein [Candidatus Micrarchaeia archaeon]
MEPENSRERVEKDIREFEDAVSQISPKGKTETGLVELAKRYRDDAEFYLKKGDLLTAFGCINYAYGIIDAIKVLSKG